MSQFERRCVTEVRCLPSDTFGNHSTQHRRVVHPLTPATMLRIPIISPLVIIPIQSYNSNYVCFAFYQTSN